MGRDVINKGQRGKIVPRREENKKAEYGSGAKDKSREHAVRYDPKKGGNK